MATIVLEHQRNNLCNLFFVPSRLLIFTKECNVIPDLQFVSDYGLDAAWFHSAWTVLKIAHMLAPIAMPSLAITNEFEEKRSCERSLCNTSLSTFILLKLCIQFCDGALFSVIFYTSKTYSYGVDNSYDTLASPHME